MTLVIGTAGHIDHGKTALLRALTGIDADRLPEERRRGMTIDVGYAYMALPDAGVVDFVDVPGHEKLVGNMLVGAGEMDAALVVVAADDGPRAQTIEHLELLDGLAVRHGLVVITKPDLVDAARRTAVAAAVRSLLDRTSLAGSPILAASAVSGEGIEDVRAAVVALVRRAAVPTGSSPAGPRLAIDRVFSVRGRGVVVTGSLRGGEVARGDELRVLPGGGSARVRELQVHGEPVDRAGPGRVAVNLSGVARDALGRGVVLVSDAAVVVSDRLLVAVAPVAGLSGRPVPLPHDRASLRLHIGTDQVGAAVGRSGATSIALPTGEATAVLRLERPAALADGDPFVLRRPSPGRTEAGGRILDARPPAGRSRRRIGPGRLVALATAADARDRDAARLDLHGALFDGHRARLARDVEASLVEAALAAVDRPAGVPLGELRALVAAELRRLVTVDAPTATQAAADLLLDLVDDGRVARTGDTVHPPGRGPAGPGPELEAAMRRLEAALDRPAPPALADAARTAGCPQAGIRLLEAAGRIVVVADDLAWSSGAWRRLAEAALELALRGPLAPAALRDTTGTSRKYVMALLEDLNRRGILTRTPAGHVPGPRTAQLRAAVPLPTAGTSSR